MEIVDFYSTEHEVRDFSLSFLEAQCRAELKDDEATITRSSTEGRILLDVGQDELGNFFDWLQDQQDIKWGQEKECLQREISDLKAQLNKAPEKKMFTVAKTNVELELESFLEIERAQTQKLQGELSNMKEALQKKNDEAKTHQAQLKEQRELTKKLAGPLQKAMEELRANTKKLIAGKKAALKKAEQERKSVHVNMQEIKSSHVAELEKSQRDHLAQLEIQHKENETIAADLKRKYEDQLASDRLLWEQEKTSLLEETEETRASFAARLDEQNQRNDTLEAALEKAEQQLQSHHKEWQEEKLSLLQATQTIQQTLQEAEQEWKTTESAMRSRLEDLEDQIAKKKKSKKWYKKLFRRHARINQC